MSDPSPDQSDVAPTAVISWQQRLRSIVPFILTALAAVALSLFIQEAVAVRQQAVALPPTATPSAPTTPEPTPGDPATPVPTPPQPDERIISQEILDLQAEMRQLWSAYYLLRAANQLADAEDALLINELAEVERMLVTVRVSLDQAYELSPEQNKGPIGEFRMQTGELREDLRVRPEGIDQRLRRLRQDMLSLVSEA